MRVVISGYRYYLPEIGRWANRDPLGEEGGFNLYGFIFNDPIDAFDYLGEYTLQGAINIHCEKKCSNESDMANRKQICLYQCKRLLTTNKYLDSKSKYIRKSQEIFDIWYNLEKTMNSGWWTVLPKCPKELCVVDGVPQKPAKDEEKWKAPKKPSLPELLLHPRTEWSMRSHAFGGHSNQCTYRMEGQKCKLITNIPGAGTVDFREPSASPSHYLHDVEPIIFATHADGNPGKTLFNQSLKDGPNVRKYYEVRPFYAE